MKKNLLSLFALIMAVAFSSYTINPLEKKDHTSVFNWFDSSDTWITTTGDSDSPEGLCTTLDGTCVRGYEEAVENHTYPGNEVQPDISYTED